MYMFCQTDNPALVNSDNDSYGCGSGGPRGAGDMSGPAHTPDIHPFFKVIKK